MQGSQLKTYSIGIAAENKPLNTRILNVTPVEKLPALDGEVTFNPQENITEGTDSTGSRYEIKTVLDITLSAEWLPMCSNRLTAPDVRRGEYVEILQLGDSDRFFWRTLGLREDLKRLETVIYAFNANPNETDNGLDISNCYFVEVSTHKKLVTFGTTKVNGEAAAYNMQFNTQDGRVVLEDDTGNFIELDSVNRYMRLENADKSFVDINRGRIEAKNKKGTYLDLNEDLARLQNASGAFVKIEGNALEINAEGGVKVKAGGTVMDFAPSGTTLKTPSFDGSQ